jgi:hypothetical protein
LKILITTTSKKHSSPPNNQPAQCKQELDQILTDTAVDVLLQGMKESIIDKFFGTQTIT